MNITKSKFQDYILSILKKNCNNRKPDNNSHTNSQFHQSSEYLVFEAFISFLFTSHTMPISVLIENQNKSLITLKDYITLDNKFENLDQHEKHLVMYFS